MINTSHANPCTSYFTEIEAYAKKLQEQGEKERQSKEDESRVAFNAQRGVMDTDIYGSSKDRFQDYVTSIAAVEDEQDDVRNLTLCKEYSLLFLLFQDDDYQNGTIGANGAAAAKKSISAPTAFLKDMVDDVSLVIYLLHETNVLSFIFSGP